jgi:hypothetical protein
VLREPDVDAVGRVADRAADVQEALFEVVAGDRALELAGRDALGDVEEGAGERGRGDRVDGLDVVRGERSGWPTA